MPREFVYYYANKLGDGGVAWVEQDGGSTITEPAQDGTQWMLFMHDSGEVLRFWTLNDVLKKLSELFPNQEFIFLPGREKPSALNRTEKIIALKREIRSKLEEVVELSCQSSGVSKETTLIEHALDLCFNDVDVTSESYSRLEQAIVHFADNIIGSKKP